MPHQISPAVCVGTILYRVSGFSYYLFSADTYLGCDFNQDHTTSHCYCKEQSLALPGPESLVGLDRYLEQQYTLASPMANKASGTSA
jgi:hypothetical protein